MMRTIARNTTRSNFSSLGNELTYNFEILVVDFELFVRAKPADLAADHKPAAAWTFFFIHSVAVHSRGLISLYHF